MAQTIGKIQTLLMRDYYKYFSKYSKGKKPEKKVAWVTSFTPVEILESLDILYYYPESYAAVISASGKEQEALSAGDEQYLSRDCCSYSCCFEGCVSTEEGPRGIPPKPDILIATNNQCNTLPNWWNILAKRYDVPLIIIDYPGEHVDRGVALNYVSKQHVELIKKLEALSGNSFSEKRLFEIIANSKRSVEAWENVIEKLISKKIMPTMLFDDINYLITARCKVETSTLYYMMGEELEQKEDSNEGIPIFWVGYPLWYHQDRFFSELLEDFRVVGSNYITWWNLDYSGENVMEMLFNAYNYTFLNLSQKSRDKRLRQLIEKTQAKCAVVLHNKSCKCDFVSAKNINIPQAEFEIDMIDRNFFNDGKAVEKIEILKESI